MLGYAVRRLLLGAVAVFGVFVITFVSVRLSGDPTYLLVPQDATQAEIDATRERLGLDRSILQQFAIYVRDAAQGDFGTSIKFGIPAFELVTSRIGPTFELAVPAFLVSLVIGVGLGVIAAVRRGTAIDRSVSALALLGQAMPGFWVAIMLILVFSLKLGWFPTSGRGGLSHLVLPVLALAAFSVAALMRLTRSAMLDVLGSEYVKLARLKGNPERVVIWKHALRNTLVTVVTYAGLTLGLLLGGAVIVETIFAWPGLGSLMVASIAARDYPVVQAGVFLTSVIFVLANLAVDLLYGVLDPRIRHGRSA